jgi:hypothetical protein
MAAIAARMPTVLASSSRGMGSVFAPAAARHAFRPAHHSAQWKREIEKGATPLLRVSASPLVAPSTCRSVPTRQGGLRLKRRRAEVFYFCSIYRQWGSLSRAEWLITTFLIFASMTLTH